MKKLIIALILVGLTLIVIIAVAIFEPHKNKKPIVDLKGFTLGEKYTGYTVPTTIQGIDGIISLSTLNDNRIYEIVFRPSSNAYTAEDGAYYLQKLYPQDVEKLQVFFENKYDITFKKIFKPKNSRIETGGVIYDIWKIKEDFDLYTFNFNLTDKKLFDIYRMEEEVKNNKIKKYKKINDEHITKLNKVLERKMKGVVVHSNWMYVMVEINLDTFAKYLNVSSSNARNMLYSSDKEIDHMAKEFYEILNFSENTISNFRAGGLCRFELNVEDEWQEPTRTWGSSPMTIEGEWF